MKVMMAALAASQVMMATACRPACDTSRGCTPVEHKTPHVRFARGTCEKRGDVLSDLFVPITSCDEVLTPNPLFTGSCRSIGNGGARCWKRGTCYKLQFVNELTYTCDCPVVPTKPCDSTANCPVGEFCRAKQNGNQCGTENECVPYAKQGESCGGFRLPCFLPQCAGGLSCQGDGLAADRPGTCELAVTCLALPSCEAGTTVDFSCTREDFASRQCVKAARCGQELPCRVAALQ